MESNNSSADNGSSTTTEVVMCHLTAAIGNGTSRTIQLIFDVVDIQDVDVSSKDIIV